MLKRGNEAMKRPLATLASLLLAQALAQVNLALSPARLELVLPPGGEVTETVRLTERPGPGGASKRSPKALRPHAPRGRGGKR